MTKQEIANMLRWLKDAKEFNKDDLARLAMAVELLPEPYHVLHEKRELPFYATHRETDSLVYWSSKKAGCQHVCSFTEEEYHWPRQSAIVVVERLNRMWLEDPEGAAREAEEMARKYTGRHAEVPKEVKVVAVAPFAARVEGQLHLFRTGSPYSDEMAIHMRYLSAIWSDLVIHCFGCAEWGQIPGEVFTDFVLLSAGIQRAAEDLNLIERAK